MAAREIETKFTGDESDLHKASQQAEKDLDKVGKSAEDMGEAFGDTATRSAQVAGGLGDLGGALAQVGGPLGSVGTGMELLGPSIMGITGAADLLEATLSSNVIAWVKNSAAIVANTAVTVAQTVAAYAVRAATLAWEAAQWLLNAALSANPIAIIIILIVALVAAIIVAYQNSETFRNIVQSTWQVIAAVISWAWENVIQPIFRLWLLQFQVAWQAAQTLANIVGSAWQAIASGIQSAWDWVSRVLGQLIDAITGLPGRIKGAASGLWDWLWMGFRDALNKIIDWWNGLTFPSFTLPKVEIPFVGTFGGQTIGGWDFPNIPRLGKGGIVTSPTLAVVGERGREAIIPLDRAGGLGNVINVTVNVPPTANPAETGRAVANALRSYFSAGGRLAVPSV